MLQKTPRDQGFVCVCGWGGGWKGRTGRGRRFSERANGYVLHICERSPARDETEYGSGMTDWRGRGREPSLMWSLLPWHMYSQQKVLRSSICSTPLLYPARLRTELDLEHQDAAERGLNIKGQRYCMSKRGLRRGANNTAYTAWDAATWHDDRLLLAFISLWGQADASHIS